MGICIQGMEFPTACRVCRLETRDCRCSAQYGFADTPDVGKRADCPLIEVPENRMFIIRDGIFYIETPKSPDGKTIILPPIESLWGG